MRILNKLLHYIRITGAYAIQIIVRVRSLDNNTILLYAFQRKGICCNPKYIMKELIKNYPGKYKLYWISKWPDTCEKGNGYEVIKLRSVKFYILNGYAKYIITNDRYDEYALKRKGQVYINTWHGGGLTKKAGFDTVKTIEEETFMKNEYSGQDYIVSSSALNSKIFINAFRIDECRILKFGMPRSDVFYYKDTFFEVRKKLDIAYNKKIVLYAPTYRKYNCNFFLPESAIDGILDALSRKFGGDWLFLYRMHYFESAPSYKDVPDKVLGCNNYFDSQELLCGVDVLITDYSSLLWDFTLLKKPSFRYSADIDIFVDSKIDFYLNYYEWPYPHASSVDELYESIISYDEDEYYRKMNDYLNATQNYDLGDSSVQFAKWINKKTALIMKGI